MTACISIEWCRHPQTRIECCKKLWTGTFNKHETYIYTAQSTFLTAKQSSLKWNLLCHFYDLKRQMAIAHHTHFDFLIFLVSTLHRFMLSSIANSDHYDNMLKTKYKIYGTHLIYHKLKVFQFLLSFVLFFRSICNAKTIKMNWTT